MSEENQLDTINYITISRKVVYFQIAMLGIVATTFFIFGIMVGQNATSPSVAPPIYDCQISGVVRYKDGRQIPPDSGAVVFLLPRNHRPDQRAPGNLVSPLEFQPLNNPGIDIIHRAGGAVARTNADGSFSVIVDGSSTGVEYFLLIVSKHVKDSQRQAMNRQQVAAIGTFFMPVDRVVDGQKFYWKPLTARRTSQDLGTIQIN